ncbi:uncharacterized protein [Paramisgurnus dabryanus]|uniref:uncharacterized protein isoform X3 n=1 Tax=Paramisgurnus dabryanus TaxID=90735 RepID=UPI003CCF6363
MKRTFTIIILFLVCGVFGDEVKSVSVMEGESVTLHSDTKIQRDDVMWLYGGSVIGSLNRETISLNDVDGIFEDRLQLNNQTGSLTINDIRTKHAGLYQVTINGSKNLTKTFSLTVQDVFIAGVENKIEGDLVTLNTGVTEIKKHNRMLWWFGPSNPEFLLAEIIINYGISYDFDDRYRDRLYVDDQTGSLTIRDLKTTDTGVYQLQISNSKETIYKRYNVFVAAAEPGLSALYIGLICAAVLLPILAVIILAVAIQYCCKYSHLKDEMKTMSVNEENSATPVDTINVTEGESVELPSGISELQDDDQIQWRSEAKDAIISVRNGKTDENCEIFKNRLKLNHQTGSLTITNIKHSDSGVYELQIKNKNPTSYKKFNVFVWFNTLKHTAGDSVTLHTRVSELKEDHQILWTFGDKNTRIAEINQASGKTQMIVYDGNDERFIDRLTLNEMNGDLTITNIMRGHSDVYKLQINSRSDRTYRSFMLIVNEKWTEMSVMEGESVRLPTDLTDIQIDDLILWMFGPEDSLIAKLHKKNKLLHFVIDEKKFYDVPDERFKDKLQLDENGSLTITGITSKHTGLYKLQIISNGENRFKKFRVSLCANRETDGAEDLKEVVSEGIPLLPIQTTQQQQ